MTIKIVIISETGKELRPFVFDNSIDANKMRDKLDSEGMDYRVEWNCK